MYLNNDACNNEPSYDIKLKYGLRNNELVSIDEIEKEKKGLKCNCVCPGCGRRLQAKLGNGKRQPHFAHDGEPCNIAVAQQSALHILAKEIIKEEKRICLPALKVKIDDISGKISQPYYYELPQEMVYIASQVFVCESVELEKRVSDIVPDIVVSIGGKECLIEIAVTHFIDETKSEKIKRIGLPVVEIDLSDLERDDLNKEKIKELLLNDNELKRWIYNPKQKEADKWALNQYINQIDQIVKAEGAKKEKEREEKEKKEQKRRVAQELINNLQIAENYEKEIKELRNDDSVKYHLKKRNFYSDNMVLPFYMDIPITGEMVFDCDRRVWQSAIFDKFLYNRKPDEEHIITLIRIQNWFVKYQDEIHINWNLTSKARYSFSNEVGDLNLFHCCIKEYLRYLSYLGFVANPSYDGNYKALAINTLEPPNKKASLRLETIIKEVNPYTWNVSREIYDLIYTRKVYIERGGVSEFEVKHLLSNDFFNKQITSSKPKLSKRGIDYKAGREEIIAKNSLTSDKNARDSFGYRWLVCTECGEIKREDEMVSYQGNTGVCRECSRRSNKQ